MKSTVKRLFACCAVVMTVCSAFAVSTIANQAWVKAYIDECIKNGKLGSSWSSDYTPAASIAAVSSATTTITNGVTGCLVATIATNEAYRVTDSTVTNIADGTYFVWDSVNQIWQNKNCAALPYFYEKEVPYTVTNAVGGAKASYYWFYYNDDKGFSSILIDGVYWMMVNGDRSKCFRLNKTTVSDSVKASLIPVQVALYEWNIFGQTVTVFTEACSRDRHDDDSSGSTDLKYKLTIHDADGSTYTYYIDLAPYFQQPSDMKDCDGYTSDGKKCILQVPDYSKWYSMDNWTITAGFPIRTDYHNIDGVQITISRENVASVWNSAWVEKMIKQSKENHEHVGKNEDNEEPEEDKEEEHTHIRGHNCKCKYVYKDGHECGDQMEHLGPEDGALCYRACSNADCDLYNQVTHGGIVAFQSGSVEKGHWCDCYGSSSGAWPLPGYIYAEHNKVETGREAYAGGYRVTYHCDVCDYTWTEYEPGDHVHEYYLVDGREVCLAMTYDDEGNEAGECRAERSHNYSKAVGECGISCQNVLAGGSTCGYTKHGGYWHRVKNGGDDYHTCDCGGETAAHGGSVTSERYVDADGYVHIKKTQTCPAPSAGCGETIETDELTGEKEETEEEEEDDEEEHTHVRGHNCCCSYVFKDGHTCGIQMNHLGPEDGVACYRACSNTNCDQYNKITHGGIVPFQSGTVEKGHWCNCYGSSQGANPLPGYIYGAHNKVEQSREAYAGGYNVTYHCDQCGYTWTEYEPGDHEHQYYLVDGREVCLAETYDAEGNSAGQCRAERAHKYAETKGNCGLNCQNELYGGGLCGYSKHGGYWHRVKTDESDYHACDCEGVTAAHGGEVKSERYIDEKGYVHIKTTRQCPDPDSGCGETVESDDLTGDKEDPNAGHSCTYAGDSIDECTRGKNCCCDEHPAHQFDHLWSTQNGCKYCRNEKCKYHGGSDKEADHNYARGYAKSLDGTSYTSEDLPPTHPDFKGHTCGCGKGNTHGHHFSKAVKVDSEYEQEVCDADPNDACGFVWKHRITSDCEHKDDLDLSTWADCVCQKCGTNRTHVCSKVIEYPAEEKKCSVAQCKNWNGKSSLCGAKAGLECSYTEATAKGTHYGWTPLEDGLKHVCGCDAKVTEYHETGNFVSVTNAITGKPATCWLIQECPKCGQELSSSHYGRYEDICKGAKVLYDFATRSTPVKCTICGLVFEEYTTYDANGNAVHTYSKEGRAQTESDHNFSPGKCVCNCGTWVKHAYPDPADFCGCFCGTNTTPHVASSGSCYCTGEYADGTHDKVLVKHTGPYQYIDFDCGSNTCQVCGTVTMKHEYDRYCQNCGDFIDTRYEEDTHTCTGGTTVGPCTYNFKWDAYDMYESGSWIHMDAGSETSTGMFAGNKWMNASSITFSGGTASVSETGTYYIYTKIDDSGTVNVGPLSGTGGGHWTKWGCSSGGATLVKGVAYPVSGNASSNQSTCGADYVLVKKGDTGPDGSVAGGSTTEGN